MSARYRELLRRAGQGLVPQEMDRSGGWGEVGRFQPCVIYFSHLGMCFLEVMFFMLLIFVILRFGGSDSWHGTASPSISVLGRSNQSWSQSLMRADVRKARCSEGTWCKLHLLYLLSSVYGKTHLPSPALYMCDVVGLQPQVARLEHSAHCVPNWAMALVSRECDVTPYRARLSPSLGLLEIFCGL